MAIFNGYIFGFIVFLSQQFVPTIDGLLWAQFTVFQVSALFQLSIDMSSIMCFLIFDIFYNFVFRR